MRYLVYGCLIVSLFGGCKKGTGVGSLVDIYLLESYTVTTNQSTNPATPVISNAVLAQTPFLADNDIKFYTKSSSTFTLKKDIKSLIQNYGPDKAFAVTVNNQPVYFGKFHPAYMSSITLGLATIDPIIWTTDTELPIRYETMAGNQDLLQLDKRNDTRIINALRETGRLR